MANVFLNQALAYSFNRSLSPFQAWKLIHMDEQDGAEHEIAEIRLGYVRLVAVAVPDKEDYITCYDLYVKDRCDAKDWVFVESIYEPVGLDSPELEDEMLRVLVERIRKNDIPYQDCSYVRKPGYKPKKI